MENLDLKKFNDACQDFMAGKYILADLKLKALIESINSSEKLLDIVSTCLQGYNFEQAFRTSLTERGISLPNDENELIAFCFNVLYNIDVGNITFLDFLNKYFSANELSGGEEFRLFSTTIIKPFNQAINNKYSQIHIIKETQDYQNNIYHKLVNISKINLDNIDNLKLKDIAKEELALLLNAMICACEKTDKKLVYAMMVGLEYFVKYNKHAKNIYEQLKDCF